MPEVVGICIRKLKETSYYNPQGIDLNIPDECLVETENDLELGCVTEQIKIINEVKGELKKVVRKLSLEDRAQIKENEFKEEEAFNICLKKIEDKELEMKLVDLSYTFNRNKLFIYYTAPERVDFRELVKDLAYVLKTRIEMYQIGVRDEAKMFGGFGLCGRSLCCISFLKDFKPVTIDMAKEQDLSLSSSKISGLCGRLMCCLAYEYEFYNRVRKDLPRVDNKIETPDGVGKVVSVNVLKKEVLVEFEEGAVKKFSICEIRNKIFRKNRSK